MKKKILLALSMVAILAVLFAITVFAAEPVKEWDVSENADGSVMAYLYSDPNNSGYYNLTISGTGGMKDGCPWHSSYHSRITSVTIEQGITSIGGSAFYYCNALTSITIPDSVTSIGNGAFHTCTSLTSVTIGDSVTNIGDGAFYYCTSLTNVTIPDSVKSVGDSAFYKCTSMKSVTIGDSVTNIGDSAFYYCSYLTSVTIPDSVKSIGDSAFYYCTSLKSITIPDSVTSIGDYVFRLCSSLTSITVDEDNQVYKSIDGNLYTKDGKTLIQYAIGKWNTSFTIPDSVKSIGDYAFNNCSYLTSVTIGDAVTSIGERAFEDCKSLTSVTIPNSVTNIGIYAFCNCKSLTSITIPDSVTSVRNWAFSDCNNLTIYCEAESQPSGWERYWNDSNRPVVWGYFDEEGCLSDIYTFKGYSFNEMGGFAVGFEIDYDALAKYERKTGKTLEIGVVFAGYNNLNGNQPLDGDGEAIALDKGMVVKADITEFGFKYYDFILSDISDEIKDVKLVIAGYIFDGEAVKYVQASGMSDTVVGVSYNEAKGE